MEGFLHCLQVRSIGILITTSDLRHDWMTLSMNMFVSIIVSIIPLLLVNAVVHGTVDPCQQYNYRAD